MDILGISFGLDTSVCLLRDGRVVAASLEERFSRIKHDRSWPARALEFCLDAGETTLRDVEHVAFFWNPTLQLDAPHPGRSRSYRHHGDYLHMVPSWLLGPAAGPGRVQGPHSSQRFELDGRAPLQVHYVTHHRAHAASAFYPSPFERAAVLTVDGFGERAATTLGAYEGGRYRELDRFDFPQSLGAFYAAVTGHLGFRPNNGEGKVMGLAPYGDGSLVDAVGELLAVDDEGRYELDLRYFRYYLDGPGRVSARFVDRFGPARLPGQAITAHHRALARGAQAALERALLGLAGRLRRLSGLDDLVLAGGVAMNSGANGRLEREGPFERLWVQPAAGDGGAAVGAALYVWHELLGGAERHRWTHDRFGPAFSDKRCREALRRGGWTWEEPADVVADTARALAAGELVGWFQGAGELGMRALGSRSILADPRRQDVKDVLNARVKFREPFRPFAPAVPTERAAEFFELPAAEAGWDAVPFMQKVHPVRAEWRERLPGVTHVDGSARLQTVTPSADDRFHALLTAFGELTGVPVLLDTSFNVKGEPIVGTPEDALRCWASTGLDRLVLGPCVLGKPHRSSP